MSNYNPYAAPAAETVVPLGTPIQGEPQPWDVGEVIKASWEIYKSHWAPLTLGYFVVTLIGALPQYVAPGLVAAGVLEAKSTGYWAVHAPLLVVGWLINQFFVAGFIRAALRALRAGQVTFGDFFSAGSRYVALVLTEILRSILLIFGLLLFVVPGVILSLGFKNASYYVIDQNLGPVAALRASWESSQGQKGDLFLLSLAQVGIVLLGLAACCLGLFVAVPVTVIAQAIVYMRMSGTAPVPPTSPQGPFGPPGPPGMPGPYDGPYGSYGGR